MSAQTHAALWCRQCIPVCLHRLATRDVVGEDREGQGVAHGLLERSFSVGDALDPRDRSGTARDGVFAYEAREFADALVCDRVRERPPDGDGGPLAVTFAYAQALTTRSWRDFASPPSLPRTPCVSAFVQGGFVPSAITASVRGTRLASSGVRSCASV